MDGATASERDSHVGGEHNGDGVMTGYNFYEPNYEQCTRACLHESVILLLVRMQLLHVNYSSVFAVFGAPQLQLKDALARQTFIATQTQFPGKLIIFVQSIVVAVVRRWSTSSPSHQ